MDNTLRARIRRYPVYFLGWTLMGLFLCSEDLARKVVTHDTAPWWFYFGTWMAKVWVLALFTPLAFWLSRRFPIERKTWFRRAALHFLFSIGFALLDLSVDALILPHLGVFPAYMNTVSGTFPFLLFVAGTFQGNILMYWGLLGIDHALSYYMSYEERAREALRLEVHASELKARLVHEQLSALKMQLQPHFLFNTLNTI